MMGTTDNGVEKTVVVFGGDGVGPDVMHEALRVLEVVASSAGHTFTFDQRKLGGCAIDAYGTALRSEDIEAARRADAVLLGAVGGPQWDDPSAKVRPEQGLLAIRKALGLFANLRPVVASEALLCASPLKEDRVRGTDLLVVRELTGGIYFGRPSRRWRERRGWAAVDTLIYREHEIRRVVELAFQLARQRKGRVTSVDKANVLTSSRLWREIVNEVATAHPDVTLEHVLVDAMAMKLIQQPSAYDVIVTENMFGDILTDEASVLGGSIGLLSSASLGTEAMDGKRPGLYEPIHGSAPDIAGQGIANPAGMILSAALMLRLSFGMEDEAAGIEQSVERAINEGVRTRDLGGDATTASFGDAVIAGL